MRIYYYKGSGHYEKDFIKEGREESGYTKKLFTRQIEYDDSCLHLTVWSDVGEGDHHYWVCVEFPGAVEHILVEDFPELIEVLGNIRDALI
jgi:hypothetical protein